MLLWTLLGLCLGLVGCSGATGLWARRGTTARAPIRIGALLALSGRSAYIGQPEEKTMSACVKDINANGGINGRAIELVVKDSGGRPDDAATLAAQFIRDPSIVACVGPSTTAETMAVIPQFQAARIPLISLAAGAEIVNPVRAWIFKVTPGDIHAVGRIYDYLSRHDVERIAVISADDPFGEGGDEQLRMQAPVFGIHIVRSATFSAEKPDSQAIAAFLNAVKTSDAQAVVMWGTSPGPAIIARLFAQQGLRQMLVSSHGIASRDFIKDAGAAADNVLFPATPLLVCESLDWNSPLRAVDVQYSRWYEARYHEAASSFGGHGWDAIMLLRDALRSTGDRARDVPPSRAKIRAWLEETRNFAGTAGIFQFSPADHNGLNRDSFIMVRISHGNWVMER